jgi:hypothetical protein
MDLCLIRFIYIKRKNYLGWHVIINFSKKRIMEERFGRKPIFTDGARWYKDYACKW